MEEKIKYKIKYSKRKTILISINNEGEVLITAPINTNNIDIEKVIISKSNWINNKLNEINNRIKLPKNKILFLGNEKEVEILIQQYLKREFVFEDENKFLINVKDKENIEKVFKKYLKNRLLLILDDKINKYIKYFESYPKDIKVKEQKRRWGSCTYDNKIAINWRLIMAPEFVLEYVLVHEMCHMIHKNHSKDFYKEVERILPQYKKSEKWLKENGYLLEISNITD